MSTGPRYVGKKEEEPTGDLRGKSDDALFALVNYGQGDQSGEAQAILEARGYRFGEESIAATPEPLKLGAALDLALEALDFRSEWLGDYGDRDYGEEKAAAMIADVVAAWKLLRDLPDLVSLKAALADLETLAGDPRRDVSSLGGELLDLHRRITTAAGLANDDESRSGEPRTILAHVNVTIPYDSPATAEDIGNEIQAALDIAAEDPGCNAPGLAAASTVAVLDPEEI